MGFSTDVMHDFAIKEVKRLYQPSLGWKVEPIAPAPGNDLAFNLTKGGRGRVERVRIVVTYERKPTQAAIQTLHPPTAPGVQDNAQKVIIVPEGAVVSGVPEDVKVVYMKSFAFRGKELVWIKKEKEKEAPAA